MDITVNEINETRKSIVAIIPANEVGKEESAILKKHSSHFKVPGFRPGKAPIAMIRKQYGDRINEELSRNLQRSALARAQADHELKIYGLVESDIGSVSSDQDAVVNLTVDVQPTFELPEYRGLTVEVEPIVVSDEDIDKAIDNIRNQRAEYETVERAAEAGDYAKIGYQGYFEGKELQEVCDKPMYTHQKNTWEEVGATEGPRVEAITEALAGMEAGAKKKIETTFAEDFEVAELAGKNVEYEVELFEVREKKLPEMNEDFFTSIQVKDLEDLKDKIRTEFTGRRENQRNGAIRESIVEQLQQLTPFTLPESSIDVETDNILSDYLNRMVSQGAKPEMFEEKREELIGEARIAGESRARTLFIVNAIAEKESIELKNEDLNASFMQEAMASGMKPQELMKELKNNRERVMTIRQNCLVNKVLDFLAKEAKVEDKEPASSES